MIFATVLPSGRCWTGTAKAPTYRPNCPSCRPTWVTSTHLTPIGTCRLRRSCWRSRVSDSSDTSELAHELVGAHDAGLLHRSAGSTAARKHAHDRQLPRHDAAAARVRPTVSRKTTVQTPSSTTSTPSLSEPSSTIWNTSAATAPARATTGWRQFIRCFVRRASAPRARCAISNGCWRSRRSDSSEG